MKPTAIEVFFHDDDRLLINDQGELEVKQIEDWLHVFGGRVEKRVLYALPATAIKYIEYSYDAPSRISTG